MAAFPAASATVNVVTGDGLKLNDRLTLWYQNLAFDYSVSGGRGGSATYFWQDAPSTASISVGSTTYTYSVTTPGGETGAIIAAGVAAQAAADTQVAFSVSANVITFTSKANTGGTVNVSGYSLWLITDSPDAFIAANIAGQINSCNWAAANTTYGLIAASTGHAITITAARYGSVNVSGTSVGWVSGAKFSGLTPGLTIVIAGTAYTIASVASPTQLTLTSAAPPASKAA